MEQKLNIPLGAWILVVDGHKAMVLRNKGDDVHPNLQVEQVLEAPSNPLTHEQGADKPARAIFRGRRSALAQPDWHELAEHHFVDDVAEALARNHRQTPIRSLIVVAPPRALAELRRVLPDELKGVIIAELDKDLTKHPVVEIERHLIGF